MELAAYIHDAWAYEQANQEHLCYLDNTDNVKNQTNIHCWNLTEIKWQSYLLPAIAIASLSGLGSDFRGSVEASQLLEPSVNAAPWCDNLYLCDTNYVLEVQTLLAKRGFSVDAMDGVYGKNTKLAVMDFQKTQKNLNVDGIPGQRTLALLREPRRDSSVIVPTSSNRTPQVTTQIISSDRVRQPIIVRADNPQEINIQRFAGEEFGNLQILLKQRGFYQGEIDGRQGQITTDAVLRAQQAYGLPLDGFAGPLTIRALLAGGSNVAFTQPAFNSLPSAQNVLEVQQLLKERGFYDDQLNGLYDLRTRSSILRAQLAYGQQATGEWNTNLLTALQVQNNVQNISYVSNNQDIRLISNNVQPVVVQPVVQPVVVQPVNVQPVNVQPVIVQPVNVQPINIYQPPVSSQNLPLQPLIILPY